MSWYLIAGLILVFIFIVIWFNSRRFKHNNEPKRKVDNMHIIIFGLTNKIHSLHKIMRERNPGATCVVGTTVDESEGQYALGSVKTRGSYTLIFVHYISGRYGGSSSEGNREQWKSTFMRSVLSYFGQTGLTGTLQWYFTEEESTASIMWKLSERPVSQCITIARALETNFLALSGGTRGR
jgi:hypothetical protein